MKGPDEVHHIGKNVDFAVSYIKERIDYDMIETHFKNTVAVCNVRGVTPVLVTERLESGSDEWYRPFLEEINKRIRCFGNTEIWNVIDFAKEFPSKAEYFHGSMHFSTEGNRARAAWIGDALVPYIKSINTDQENTSVSA
tara:strand:+ start:108 stop:527 length:420 start_codon:yes stop_codon:yes gene_type:complete